ncbi:MAG: putative Methyltransferase [Candidatus Saccharibacteria bacterium]|nr:putative Methyltransferase [Candidatus Saccharibacteria bacterium]
MNIRIISGEFGGRKIEAPDTDKTHPMSERARNALFNSIAHHIEGAKVLDVFAGTGAIGLEALSRGAHDVTFVERDRTAQQVLAKNVTTLNVENRVVIARTNVENWLTTRDDGLYDLIFADPPYGDTQFSTVSQLFGLLKPNALMVLSHPGRGEIPTKTGVVVVDNRSYGNAYLTFYRREDA